jgi:hypothetical protein
MAESKTEPVILDSERKDGLMFLKFADAEVPKFKEVKASGIVSFGEDNGYPQYLEKLYNKSAKHNACIDGKSNFIFGKGYANGDFVVNRNNESLNDVIQKCIKDVEIYGGFRMEVIWSFGQKVVEVYHTPFGKIRRGADGNFYFKETWDKYAKAEGAEMLPAFDVDQPYGRQIYAYDTYRPGLSFYPLPSYLAANNYIECDIEISKFNLSSIRNGMAPSKLIQFFNGEPTEEGKRAIERRFDDKFAGSENAGKFILAFHPNKDKSLEVSDLSGSDLDKMYIELNKTVEQEIFTAHLVTSPMLFGIKTEGQLGGATELNIAYSIFQNTYSKPRAKAIDKEVNFLFSFSSFAGEFELVPSDPVGVQIDPKDVINSMPKAFVFKALGIPEDMWELENIGADNRPTPTIPIAAPSDDTAPGVPGAQGEVAVNPHLKNITPKQWQQIRRVANDLQKKRIQPAAAILFLVNSFGLSEDDARVYLNLPPVAKMSTHEQEDFIIDVFDSFGQSKEDFELIKIKTVSFSNEFEAEADEEIWIKQAFAVYDVTVTEEKILSLIRKDAHITPEVIASVLNQTLRFVNSVLESLTAKGLLSKGEALDGTDPIIEWTTPPAVEVSAPPPPKDAVPNVKLAVRYSYEPKAGLKPVIETTRPFCRKLIQLNRMYSRADIEKISARLGYSVFDRKGGWWGKNPECRHRWVSAIVRIK